MTARESARSKDDVTGCILAGGRGRRLGGATKPLLVVDGERIVDRQRRVLAPRVAEVVIALAGPGPLAELGLPTVIDRHADAGPLAGVDAALAARDRPWLLVVAGDMPDLSGDVLDLLLAARRPDIDAVVPRVNGYPEPLLAVYGRTAAPTIARALADGRRKSQAILADLRVAWLDEPALRAVDPDLASFRNLNHFHQLDRVDRIE